VTSTSPGYHDPAPPALLQNLPYTTPWTWLRRQSRWPDAGRELTLFDALRRGRSRPKPELLGATEHRRQNDRDRLPVEALIRCRKQPFGIIVVVGETVDDLLVADNSAIENTDRTTIEAGVKYPELARPGRLCQGRQLYPLQL
jgi:hypothetical protein